MKRLPVIISLFITVLLVLGLVISCAPKPKEKIILRLMVPAPPGDMLTVKDEELAQRFNERAKGEYEMRVFTGEQLAKVPEYLEAVRTGAAEMMDIGWGMFAGADPRLGAHEVPFMYNNVRANAAIQDELVELMDPVFQEKFNQKALASFTTGAMEYIGKKPLKTLEDWQGLLIGAINPPIAGLVNQLGGAPVTVMWIELYTNLEKGVIEGALQSTHGTLELKLTDVISYVTLFYGPTGANGYTINLDVWKAMPKHIQDILLEETKRTAEKMNQTFIRLHDEDIDALRALGIDVYILPNAERERWKEAARPFTDSMIANLGEFGQKMKQIADKANAENP